jgi:hypothetical protein
VYANGLKVYRYIDTDLLKFRVHSRTWNWTTKAKINSVRQRRPDDNRNKNSLEAFCSRSVHENSHSFPNTRLSKAIFVPTRNFTIPRRPYRPDTTWHRS